MASINVLSAEEIKAVKAKSVDSSLIEPYVPALTAAAVGSWISIKLDEGEESRTIKRRMSLAAKSVGKMLAWKRDRADGAIVAEIKVPSASATTPSETPATSTADNREPVAAGRSK